MALTRGRRVAAVAVALGTSSASSTSISFFLPPFSCFFFSFYQQKKNVQVSYGIIHVQLLWGILGLFNCYLTVNK